MISFFLPQNIPPIYDVIDNEDVEYDEDDDEEHDDDYGDDAAHNALTEYDGDEDDAEDHPGNPEDKKKKEVEEEDQREMIYDVPKPVLAPENSKAVAKTGEQCNWLVGWFIFSILLVQYKTL